MLKRIGRRLTFANLASAAALFVALSGGTALAISSGTDRATVTPASDCSTDGVLALHAPASAVICTVGSLTISADCTASGPDTSDSVSGTVLLSTSTDHAFVDSDPDFNPDESPLQLAGTTDGNRGGWTVRPTRSFEASESPVAGGRHLGGTIVIRSRFKAGSPPFAKCQFAVDALTS
jgi:hypothetical protein